MRAQLIQSSCCPPRLCHESVEIAFRSVPFSEVGGDFVDFFCLPNGFIGIYLGTWSAKACLRPCTPRYDRNPARHSQERHRYRQRSYPVERAPAPASPPRTFLLDPVRAFQSSHAELIFSNAGMPLPMLVPELAASTWERADCPQECLQTPPMNETSCNSDRGSVLFGATAS